MNVDEFLFRAINGLAGQAATVDWVMVQLSDPDLLWLPGGLVAGYWLWVNWREAILAGPVLAASVGVVDFLGTLIKDLAARPRPCSSLQHVHQLLGCGKAFGFPSNHAGNTAAAAAFFQVLYPRTGWLSWPLVFAIGFSRVYIGAHYVTDVVGGWMIGGLFGGGVAWLLLQWPRFRSSFVRAGVTR